MAKKLEGVHGDPFLAILHDMANSLTSIQLTATLLDQSVGASVGEEGKTDIKDLQINSEKCVRYLHALRRLYVPTPAPKTPTAPATPESK